MRSKLFFEALLLAVSFELIADPVFINDPLPASISTLEFLKHNFIVYVAGTWNQAGANSKNTTFLYTSLDKDFTPNIANVGNNTVVCAIAPLSGSDLVDSFQFRTDKLVKSVTYYDGPHTYVLHKSMDPIAFSNVANEVKAFSVSGTITVSRGTQTSISTSVGDSSDMSVGGTLCDIVNVGVKMTTSMLQTIADSTSLTFSTSYNFTDSSQVQNMWHKDGFTTVFFFDIVASRQRFEVSSYDNVVNGVTDTRNLRNELVSVFYGVNKMLRVEHQTLIRLL